MNEKRPRDPIGEYQRKSTADRRLAGHACACGESRPEALIAGSSPTICAVCARKQRGQTPWDMHHPAGKANNATQVPIDVNDHRAVLTPQQYDWPRATWENPQCSPLLAGAASIRGYCETVEYLADTLLIPDAELLEELDEMLTARLGKRWWVGTKLEKLASRRKRDGKQSG